MVTRLESYRRRTIAAGLRRAVAVAQHPPAAFSAAVPVQDAEVRATRAPLLALAAAVGEDGARPAGLRLARLLLCDSTSPLYAPSPPGALWDAVEDALFELDHERADRR